MSTDEITQVVREAAEVYEDLEEATPLTVSRDDQIALIDYNLREADEVDVEELDEAQHRAHTEWIARLNTALQTLQS